MTHFAQGSMPHHRARSGTQRVMARHNALAFYGLAAASFLESAIPLHASVLLDVFSDDPELRRWIEQTWWPVKSMHARESRAQVESIWPEFDWSAAYGEFYEAYRPLVVRGRSGCSPAREALTRCVTAAQTAAFYRCLGAAIDDSEVRGLLYAMSADEASHFDCLRRVYERRRRAEGLGLLAAYRAIVTCARSARDVDVRLAYYRLAAPHWYSSAPFPELEYPDFVRRMRDVVRRHMPLGPAQRLLFHPWLTPRGLRSEVRSPSTARVSPVVSCAGLPGRRTAVRTAGAARL